MEIKKGYARGSKEQRCAIYFSSANARLNAASRDALDDPEYVRLFYSEGKITIYKGTEKDYKVTKAKSGQRFISGAMFMGVVADIPQKEKIYGIFEDGALCFVVPKKYRK